MRRTLMILFIVMILVITACDDLPDLTGTPGDQEDVSGQPSAGLANPASEYCVDQGGELEIRDEAKGQVGYCIFPDGSECEEWSFFRGECAPGGQETSDSNPSQAYQPLDPAACSDVAKAVQETFTLDVTTEQVAFDDYVSGETGAGCQATAVGSGYDFGSLAEASAILGVMLEARGWEEDMQYQADGPTGIATAYRLDDALCLVNIIWQPADDADCPADQPISVCELPPEHQLYMATVNCARHTSGSESPVGGLPTVSLANPASQHCVDQGGELEIRDETDGQVGKRVALFMRESHSHVARCRISYKGGID